MAMRSGGWIAVAPEHEGTVVNNYRLEPWVAVVVIVLTVWRAFHGPYSDDWWRSIKNRWRSVTRR